MAVRIAFGGQPVLDPVDAARAIQEHGKPVPADLAKANSLFNPNGREPARGWFILQRSSLNAIGVDTLFASLWDDGQGRKAYIPGLVISKEPLCLAPSVYANDPNAIYLVEVSDSRWLCKNPHFQVAIDKQYNVRAPAYGGSGTPATQFYADSLNSGSLWTWNTLISDLWGSLPMLGTAPTLPFTPDGSPEGWIFPGSYAWDALCDVLERISCAVRWNWLAGTYDIVQIAAADTASDAILAAADSANRKIHDAGYLPIVLGREPATIRVFFHRREQFAGTEETNTRIAGSSWQTIHSYHVDVSAGNNAAAGTYHVLWDDLAAIYDASGSLTNGAALATRAAERAAEYLNSLRTVGGARLHKTYSGLLLLTPGSTIKGVAFRQRQVMPDGEGDMVTEVVRHPFDWVKVDSNGQWEECCSSVPVQPPMFGPQLPSYPLVEQVLKVSNGTISAGKYDCKLEKPDGSGSWSDKEDIYAVDLSGATQLTAGSRYKCRLVGYTSSRVLYAFRSGAGTITDPVTYNSAVTFNNSVTYSTNSTVTDNSTTTYGPTYNATYQGNSTVNYSTNSIYNNDAIATYSPTYNGTYQANSQTTWNSNSNITVNGNVTYGGTATNVYSANSLVTYNSGVTINSGATINQTGGTTTYTGNANIITTASTTGGAGITITVGATPSAPTDGSVWVTTTGIFVRVNGVTYNLTAGGGGIGPGTPNTLPKWITTTTIGDSRVIDDGTTITIPGTSISLGTASATTDVTVPNNGTLHFTGSGITIQTDVDYIYLGKTGGQISFLGSGAHGQQTSGADLTNNVTSGGTSDVIDDWTNLTVYATDAAAIRNAVYQLARKLKQINDGLRTFGLFT